MLREVLRRYAEIEWVIGGVPESVITQDDDTAMKSAASPAERLEKTPASWNPHLRLRGFLGPDADQHFVLRIDVVELAGG